MRGICLDHYVITVILQRCHCFHRSCADAQAAISYDYAQLRAVEETPRGDQARAQFSQYPMPM
eukprot:2946822-Pyramimonas_sp.AAC.1